MEKCFKCNGSGLYRSFGICFQCKGKGQIKSGRGPIVDSAPIPATKVIDCAKGLHEWFVAPFGKYCGQCGERN